MFRNRPPASPGRWRWVTYGKVTLEFLIPREPTLSGRMPDLACPARSWRLSNVNGDRVTR
ncbi:MAG: hypothetical protein ACE5F1_07820 [Planctomycetota bacterium]